MIKAITFDLDGVYFPDGKVNFIHKLLKPGASQKAKPSAYSLKATR